MYRRLLPSSLVTAFTALGVPQNTTSFPTCVVTVLISSVHVKGAGSWASSTLPAQRNRDAKRIRRLGMPWFRRRRVDKLRMLAADRAYHLCADQNLRNACDPFPPAPDPWPSAYGAGLGPTGHRVVGEIADHHLTKK